MATSANLIVRSGPRTLYFLLLKLVRWVLMQLAMTSGGELISHAMLLKVCQLGEDDTALIWHFLGNVDISLMHRDSILQVIRLSFFTLFCRYYLGLLIYWWVLLGRFNMLCCIGRANINCDSLMAYQWRAKLRLLGRLFIHSGRVIFTRLTFSASRRRFVNLVSFGRKRAVFVHAFDTITFIFSCVNWEHICMLCFEVWIIVFFETRPCVSLDGTFTADYSAKHRRVSYGATFRLLMLWLDLAPDLIFWHLFLHLVKNKD